MAHIEKLQNERPRRLQIVSLEGRQVTNLLNCSFCLRVSLLQRKRIALRREMEAQGEQRSRRK